MEKTLLLDLDGTLSNSFPGIKTSFLRALDQMGITPPEDVSYIAGPPMVDTLAGLGLSQEEVKQALDLYLADQHAGSWAQTSLFPGVKELLSQWKDEGYRLVTATSKGEHFAELAVERLGLASYIGFLGAAEEGYHATRRTKEAVIGYVLAECEIDPARALMVGDRIHDCEGARQFGIETVLVGWGYGTPEEHAQAAYFAETPEDLARIVREWGAGL